MPTSIPPLADATTLQIGGVPAGYVEVASEEDFIEAVAALDKASQGAGGDGFGEPSPSSVLVLGGGSNLVVSDNSFPGTVIKDIRNGITTALDPSCAGVTLEVAAGNNWDALVAQTIDEGWSGLEALSGIPGTVGASPVQNIGAYGHELSENLCSVRVYDRLTGEVLELPRQALGLGYRDSILKRSLTNIEDGGGRIWGPTGRWVVLSVTLQLLQGQMSAPVRYRELASLLEVEIGQSAPSKEVREAVLALRRSKGMVLDPADPDSWSAGSFFTNPILTEQQADEFLPFAAPRFAVEDRTQVAFVNPNRPAPTLPGKVKTSAAWLIEQAGFTRGFRLTESSRATISTKHVLAITNRGGASSEEVVALARTVRGGVENHFGIRLEPEPVLVGVSL